MVSFLRFDLASFHIGLIEGVDPDDRPGDRRRDFPAEEFLADIVDVGKLDAYNGLARLFESGDGGVLRLIRLGLQTEIREHAIVAVNRRLAERFAVDRDNALADFAGRFGEKLLEPRAKVVNARRRDDRDLVAAVNGGGAENRAKDHAGILVGSDAPNRNPCTISCVILRNFGMSMPITAPGTMPKSERAE